MGTESMEKKQIFIVEDEFSLRDQYAERFKRLDFEVLKAEHMDDAKEILFGEMWNHISLVIIDVMLPENDKNAKKIRELINKREEPYNKWLQLDANSVSHFSIEWIRTRFEVDTYDRKIFDLLNLRGGIDLVKMCAEKYYPDNIIRKPVIFFTARENDQIKQEGLKYIDNRYGKWLTKPLMPEVLESIVKQLLA